MLVNLGKIHELFGDNFGGDHTEYEHGIPGLANSSVRLYPQAGLRSAGHFQATGLMKNFYPHVEALNRRLRQQADGEDDDDRLGRCPIFGVGCQGYNAVMHSTRGYGAQHHEAQQGVVTAALGGHFVIEGTSGLDHWKKVLQDCSHNLPHKVFELKISNEGITRDLRLENVYVVDMTALKEDDRSGE